MINFIIIYFPYILLIAIIYRLIKSCWISYITLQTRYKIYKLRDKIRRIAIDNPKHDPKTFEYLDISLSKGTNILSKLNFWVMVYLVFKHRIGDSVVEKHRIVEKVLHKDSDFHEAYVEYNSIFKEYILCKSCGSIILFLVPAIVLVLPIRLLGTMNKSINHLVKRIPPIKDWPKYVSVLPETSNADIYF